MAINWEMGVSDPMRGMNQGLANLGQILQQSRAQDMQQERQRPAMELQSLQLAQAKQAAADEAGLRTNLASLQPTMSGGYTDATTGQEVPQTSTPANTTKAAYDYWSKIDPAKAEAIADGVFSRAQHMAKSTDNHAGAVDFINQKLGFNLKYVGSKGNIINLKNGDGSEMAYDLTSGKIVAEGAPKPIIEKSEYKTREYEKGNTKIFEESQDGGKTWKQVSSAPRYKPTTNISTGAKERDLPTGIQDKLSSKLEIYNDWSTLKNGFKPEYMPKTPFKNIGEFQINLNKIFGNNQAAVDWWTQYFDARNIILKERSGAAVMEPEFKRFEQGTIAANTNPTTVINYLDRSSKKYKQHVDSYLEANRKNHPESIKAFENAYGYVKDTPAPKGGTATPVSSQLKKSGKGFVYVP